jgi:hypothetical protein
LAQTAQAYAAKHRLRFAERLGFGIHGVIFATEGNPEAGEFATAVKVFRAREFYLRELAVYERLGEVGVQIILGFNVLQLRRFDAELGVIEMTIVIQPFVLDFAGVCLDAPPEFPAAV